MEPKRKRVARAAQKRIYESIDISYRGADPIAVQQVRQKYPESATTGSTAYAAAVSVDPSTLHNAPGNAHDAAYGSLARNDRFGSVVLATACVQISLTPSHSQLSSNCYS